jgi:glycosyltransferase involved in cell wall biosynthesis
VTGEAGPGDDGVSASATDPIRPRGGTGDQPRRSLRILIEAYACEPASGSEPGVGWNWSVQAALHGHRVVVITRANNRDAIEEARAASPIPNLEFCYFDLPLPFTRLKKRFGYVGLYAYYYAWQIGVWRMARHLHRRNTFDLVHHVTFVNDWMPSGVAGVRAPFIWGPVGGSTHVMPDGLERQLPTAFKRYEVIRRTFQQLVSRVDPLVALTRRRASLILAYTDEALGGIPRRHRRKARSIIHIGVSEADAPRDATNEFPSEDALTVVSGGRLVHWKGFDLLVEGFGEYVRTHGDVRARLVFTGDGPFRPFLEALVAEHGVGNQVTFLGHLPTRDDVYRALMAGHLYALPTLRDGPPVAILEAMLAGKPILCVDLGAPHELVPDEAGLKIPFGERRQMTQDIAAALAWARTHPKELRERGDAARRHALAVHDWRRIGDEVDAIYRSLVQ